MRLPVFIAALYFIMPFAFAQQPAMPSRSTIVDVYGIMGVPLTIKKPEVEGTPLINEMWGKGYILFKNGRKVMNVELNFSQAENTLYFRKDKTEFGFTDELKEGQFTIDVNSASKTYLFRCGYPSTEKTGNNFFFQVLVEGQKFHLLKYGLKKIEEHWQYNEPAKSVFKLQEELYVYDVANNSLAKIKKDKNSLPDNFSAYADKAKDFMQQKKYKFRSDAEITELVNYLNQ